MEEMVAKQSSAAALLAIFMTLLLGPSVSAQDTVSGNSTVGVYEVDLGGDSWVSLSGTVAIEEMDAILTDNYAFGMFCLLYTSDAADD